MLREEHINEQEHTNKHTNKGEINVRLVVGGRERQRVTEGREERGNEDGGEGGGGMERSGREEW